MEGRKWNETRMEWWTDEWRSAAIVSDFFDDWWTKKLTMMTFSASPSSQTSLVWVAHLLMLRGPLVLKLSQWNCCCWTCCNEIVVVELVAMKLDQWMSLFKVLFKRLFAHNKSNKTLSQIHTCELLWLLKKLKFLKVWDKYLTSTTFWVSELLIIVFIFILLSSEEHHLQQQNYHDKDIISSWLLIHCIIGMHITRFDNFKRLWNKIKSNVSVTMSPTSAQTTTRQY